MDKNRVIFNDIYKYGKPFMKYIHPIQQKFVISILEEIPEYIDKIYIFGSSVTIFCNEDSDLDLIVIGPKEKEKEVKEYIYSKSKGIPKDILYVTEDEFNEYKYDFGSVIEECFNLGVVIYERGE